MLHSDLVETLRVFSDDEWHRLMLFYESPYHVNGRDVAKGYTLIKYVAGVIRLNQSDTALERETVYAVLYPGHSYHAQTLNNLVSVTLSNVRAFIEMEMMRRAIRPTSSNVHLLDFFLKKGALDMATLSLKRLERSQKSKNSKDYLDFLHDSEAEHIKSLYTILKGDLKKDANLLKAMDALELYYWIKRLDLLIALFNLRNFNPKLLSDEDAALFIDELEKCSAKTWFSNILIQLYRHTLHFLFFPKDQAEEKFEAFMKLLAKHEKEMPSYHLERFETLAYNFCAPQFGTAKYQTMLYDLFNRKLERNRHTKEEVVMATEFLSAVKSGILTGQLDFVRTFLEEFRGKITGAQPSEDYYQAGLALFLFAQGYFDETRAITAHLNFRDNAFRYFIKCLDIKTLYEMGDKYYETLDTHLHAFRIAVERETNMPKKKLDPYKKFHKYITRLDRLRRKKLDKNQLRRLQHDVHADNKISESIWLKQKIEAMGATIDLLR